MYLSNPFSFTRLHNYINNGQDIEQSIRYKATGVLCKADNKPCTLYTDIDIYQIKSSSATVCKGTDIIKHTQQDKASLYIYGTRQGKGYILTKEQYNVFVEVFSRVTKSSKGDIITRLKDENKAMLVWLDNIIQWTLYYHAIALTL